MLLLASVALAVWIFLSLDPARRWPRGRVLPVDSFAAGGDEVRAIVPARNEAEALPDTLPRLLAQGDPVRLVLVVDDRSEDGTVDVARRLGEAGSGPTPLDVVSVKTLPAGWAGKVHAMETGLRALDETWQESEERRWVLFTDADIEHPEDVARRLLAKSREGYDLVSVMARLRAVSFWERLLIPAFVWFFHAMYPFRLVGRKGSRVAAAAGGLMLVRLDALRRAGGPVAWKDAIIDDVALARGVKKAGGRIWLGFAEDVISRRPYETLASIIDMVARSAFVELRRRYALVPLVWAALLLVFVVPVIAVATGIATGSGLLTAIGASACLLQLVHVLPSFRWHRAGAGFALLMPVAAVLYAWMTTVSAWRHLRGRRTTWRAR